MRSRREVESTWRGSAKETHDGHVMRICRCGNVAEIHREVEALTF